MNRETKILSFDKGDQKLDSVNGATPVAVSENQVDLDAENRRADLPVNETVFSQGEVQEPDLRNHVILESACEYQQFTLNESIKETIGENSKGRQGQGIEDTLMSELIGVEGQEGSEGRELCGMLRSGERQERPLTLRVPLRDCSNLSQVNSKEGVGRPVSQSKGQLKRRARL